MTFTAANVDQIETHLASHPYLSEGGLPGAQDAQVFFDLGSNSSLIIQSFPTTPLTPTLTSGTASSTASQTIC
jgi:hypothetical protein